MADLIRITGGAIVLTGAGPIYLQPLAQVLEVSAYDQLDARFFLHTLTGGGSAKFDLLTGFEPKSEDDWEPLSALPYELPGAGSPPIFTTATLPEPVLATTAAAPKPLLRYIRWKVTLVTATAATVQIVAMARRKAL